MGIMAGLSSPHSPAAKQSRPVSFSFASIPRRLVGVLVFDVVF